MHLEITHQHLWKKWIELEKGLKGEKQSTKKVFPHPINNFLFSLIVLCLAPRMILIQFFWKGFGIINIQKHGAIIFYWSSMEVGHETKISF
jgi:hypothetical protein